MGLGFGIGDSTWGVSDCGWVIVVGWLHHLYGKQFDRLDYAIIAKQFICLLFGDSGLVCRSHSADSIMGRCIGWNAKVTRLQSKGRDITVKKPCLDQIAQTPSPTVGTEKPNATGMPHARKH